MNLPLVSIIVPIYKAEHYLDTCIKSILNQTYTNLEVILVDDGSPDNCPAICDMYAEKDSRVRVIHKKNGGVSSARNTGLDYANGQYICFVDSDDWIEAKMVEHLYDCIQKNNTDAAVCLSSDYSEDGAFIEKWDLDWRKPVADRESLIRNSFFLIENRSDEPFIFWMTAWGKLIKRSFWENVRFRCDLYLGEDVQAWLEIAVQIQSCAFLNESLYNYRIREGAAYSMADQYSKSKGRYIRSLVTYDVFKNHPEYQKYALENLIFAAFGHLTAIAKKKKRSEFNEIRRTIVLLKGNIQRDFQNYTVKYRLGLRLLFYFPDLLWSGLNLLP